MLQKGLSGARGKRCRRGKVHVVHVEELELSGVGEMAKGAGRKRLRIQTETPKMWCKRGEKPKKCRLVVKVGENQRRNSTAFVKPKHRKERTGEKTKKKKRKMLENGGVMAKQMGASERKKAVT